MLRAFGVAFDYSGENIAYGATFPDEVVEDWSYSPTHYENLLLKIYRKTGVGCAKDKNGTTYWVPMCSD
jgi:uncharacterized protein YkwD